MDLMKYVTKLLYYSHNYSTVTLSMDYLMNSKKIGSLHFVTIIILEKHVVLQPDALNLL